VIVFWSSRSYSARANVGARAWALAGADARGHQVTAKAPLAVDLDAELITALSEAGGRSNFRTRF